MDKQSVVNALSGVLALWVLVQAAHLTPQLPVVPLDPKELV